MVSKLWCVLESSGELIKYTNALTPNCRLGLSGPGQGPRYMHFLIQVILMQWRFENLWCSSRHGEFKWLSTACQSPSVSKARHGCTPSTLQPHVPPLYLTMNQCRTLAAGIFPSLLGLPCLLDCCSCFLCLACSASSLPSNAVMDWSGGQKDHVTGTTLPSR